MKKMYLTGTKSPHILRFYGAHKDKLYAGPANLFIDITTRCNLKCLYCWDHSPLLKKETPPGELSFKTMKGIIDDAKGLGAEKAVITGDGEPTLHRDFNRIIDYIHRKKMAMVLITNGLINKKAIDSLFKINLVKISSSVPGAQPSKNNLLGELIKNVKYLKKDKTKRIPILNFIHILTKRNLTEIPKIIRLAAELDISDVEFAFMDPVEETRPLQLKEPDLKRFREIVKEAASDRRLKKMIKERSNLLQLYLTALRYEKSVYNFRRCFSGWFNLFVDSNGNVCPCCINEDLVGGSVFKNSLKEIWYSRNLHKIRLDCKYRFDRKKKIWQKCRYCDEAPLNNNVENFLKKLERKK